jgi:hypothetical protein
MPHKAVYTDSRYGVWQGVPGAKYSGLENIIFSPFQGLAAGRSLTVQTLTAQVIWQEQTEEHPLPTDFFTIAAVYLCQVRGAFPPPIPSKASKRSGNKDIIQSYEVFPGSPVMLPAFPDPPLFYKNYPQQQLTVGTASASVYATRTDTIPVGLTLPPGIQIYPYMIMNIDTGEYINAVAPIVKMSITGTTEIH